MKNVEQIWKGTKKLENVRKRRLKEKVWKRRFEKVGKSMKEVRKSRKRVGTSRKKLEFCSAAFGTRRSAFRKSASCATRPAVVAAEAQPLLTATDTSCGTILVFFYVSCFSDFLGRLQPPKTTIQKTPGTLGVEKSSSPWKVLHFYTSNSSRGRMRAELWRSKGLDRDTCSTRRMFLVIFTAF